MKEGVRYSLDNPPDSQDLSPGEHYMEVYNKWAIFKASIEFLASERGLDITDAYRLDEVYNLAVQFSEQETDEGEDGLKIFA